MRSRFVETKFLLNKSNYTFSLAYIAIFGIGILSPVSIHSFRTTSPVTKMQSQGIYIRSSIAKMSPGTKS